MSSRAGERLTLRAEMADGKAIPQWLTFNANSGTFEGTPPAGFTGELQIKVTARDGQGNEVEALFRFNVGTGTQGGAKPPAGGPEKPSPEKPLPGRASLRQQMRALAPRQAILLARSSDAVARAPVR